MRWGQRTRSVGRGQEGNCRGGNEQRDTRREGLGVGAGWEGLGEAREKQVQSPKLEDCKINSVLFPLGPRKS